MAHKLHAILEGYLILLITNWHTVAGVFSALCAAVYYLSMLKMNVVDKKYNGSWVQYFKHSIKNIIKQK